METLPRVAVIYAAAPSDVHPRQVRLKGIAILERAAEAKLARFRLGCCVGATIFKVLVG